jgi:hypothetical protein
MTDSQFKPDDFFDRFNRAMQIANERNKGRSFEEIDRENLEFMAKMPKRWSPEEMDRIGAEIGRGLEEDAKNPNYRTDMDDE